MAKKYKADIPNVPLDCPECRRLKLEGAGIFPYSVELTRVNDGKDQVTIDVDGTSITGISYVITPKEPSILINFSCDNGHHFRWAFIEQGDGIKLALKVLGGKNTHEHSIWL